MIDAGENPWNKKLYFYILEYNRKSLAKTEEEKEWQWDISRMSPTVEGAKRKFLEDRDSIVLSKYWKNPTNEKQKKDIRNVNLYAIPAVLIEEGEPKEESSDTL
jgi:hypothetical protein